MKYFLHPGHYDSDVLYYSSINPAKQLLHHHMSPEEWLVIGFGIIFIVVIFLIYSWSLTGRLPFEKKE